MERLIDIFFALFFLLLLSPLLFLIVIILRFTGENKILFFQKRIGKNYNEFNLIKFATMLENSPNIGSKSITIKKDPRILPFGHILRKTKLNEILQLVNILKGEMSFVGPRPLTRENFILYDSKIRDKILSVTPGLTGIGSIFFRNEEEMLQGNKSLNFYKKQIAPYKGNLELWFVRNKNLKIYFKIIILTGIVLFISNQKLFFMFFKNLPKPPASLKF